MIRVKRQKRQLSNVTSVGVPPRAFDCVICYRQLLITFLSYLSPSPVSLLLDPRAKRHYSCTNYKRDSHTLLYSFIKVKSPVYCVFPFIVIFAHYCRHVSYFNYSSIVIFARWEFSWNSYFSERWLLSVVREGGERERNCVNVWAKFPRVWAT